MIFDPFWDDFWPVLGWFLTHFWTPHFWGVLDPHFGPGVVPPYHPPLGGQKTSQKGEKWGPLEGGVPPLTWVPPLLFWKTVKMEKMPYKCPIFFGFIVFLALFSIVLTRFGGRGGQNGVFLTRFWGVLDPFFDPPRGCRDRTTFYHDGETFITFEKQFCFGETIFFGQAILLRGFHFYGQCVFGWPN